MVDRDVLSARLNALETYLSELRPFQQVPEDRYVKEPGLHHLAERYLHLASEALLDIAHHVIADEGFRQAETYRDAMQVLAEEGLIDENLADRLEEWMGFRNVLVHLYLEIDHHRTWSTIQNDLDDLGQFAAAMGRLLG